MSVLAPGKSHGGFRAAGSHNEIACRADPLGIIRDCRLRRSANRQPREVSAIKAGASPYFTTKMEKSHKQAQFDARPADQAPICSGLLIGMTSFSSKWILSHSTCYKKSPVTSPILFYNLPSASEWLGLDRLPQSLDNRPFPSPPRL
jgi:hypothetical protein